MLAALAVWLAACDGSAAGPPDFEVVTSMPAETTISGAGTRAAAAVWPEMINGARRIARHRRVLPGGRKRGGARTGDRGRPGRRPARREGAHPQRRRHGHHLSGDPGPFQRPARTSLTRLFDWKKLSGGVLHAKYFVVDGREAYRRHPEFRLALAEPYPRDRPAHPRSPFRPGAAAHLRRPTGSYSGGDRTAYQKLALLPPLRFRRRRLPGGQPGALQPARGRRAPWKRWSRLLDKRPQPRHRPAPLLQPGGRKAGRSSLRHRPGAAPGGRPRRARAAAGLGLEPAPPAARRPARAWPGCRTSRSASPSSPRRSRGFIPYARVIHSKVMRVDDDLCWVGTSNWGYDYFFRSRNVEVVLRRPGHRPRPRRALPFAVERPLCPAAGPGQGIPGSQDIAISVSDKCTKNRDE